MPLVSTKLPKSLSPAVETSAKLGLSSASRSLMLMVPVAVTSASPILPSVTEPVVVPEATAASSVPVMVIVTVLLVPSAVATVSVSVRVAVAPSC